VTIQKDQAEEPWSATGGLYTSEEGFEAPPGSVIVQISHVLLHSTTFDDLPLLTDVSVHDSVPLMP